MEGKYSKSKYSGYNKRKYASTGPKSRPNFDTQKQLENANQNLNETLKGKLIPINYIENRIHSNSEKLNTIYENKKWQIMCKVCLIRKKIQIKLL